jgi:hypothetical protein
MRFGLEITTVALAVGIALGACAEDKDRYPGIQPCTGSMCGGVTPGVMGGGEGGSGGGMGSGGSGAGGAAATIDQTGTVHRITSPDFQDIGAPAYAGAATIVALPSAGGSFTAPYGGTNGTTFDLKGIPSGGTWFFVQDDTAGAAGIISTFSYANVPVLTGVTLPAIDVGVLENIASNLPSVSAVGVSPLAAQVIIFVEHAGAPYKGVSVSGGGAGAQVAYDSGAGYSDSAAATGTFGVAILFNAGLSGSSTIALTDTSTNKTYGVEVQAAPGAATLATVEIQ